MTEHKKYEKFQIIISFMDEVNIEFEAAMTLDCQIIGKKDVSCAIIYILLLLKCQKLIVNKTNLIKMYLMSMSSDVFPRQLF